MELCAKWWPGECSAVRHAVCLKIYLPILTQIPILKQTGDAFVSADQLKLFMAEEILPKARRPNAPPRQETHPKDSSAQQKPDSAASPSQSASLDKGEETSAEAITTPTASVSTTDIQKEAPSSKHTRHIDNKELLCQHGRLNPGQAEHVKRVSGVR